MSEPAPDAPPTVDFAALPPIAGGSSLRAEWWIAYGHLRSKKSELFLNLVALFAILGVTAGVALLNCVVAVMTGFEVDLRDKILGANAHVVVFGYNGVLKDPERALAAIDAVPGVDGAAPFVYTEMMIRSDFGQTGVVVKGVDPVRTPTVTALEEDLIRGYAGDLTTDALRSEALRSLAGTFPGLDHLGRPREDQPQLPGLLVGVDLQQQLQVRPGDLVQLINPVGGPPGPMGMPTPTILPLRVAGVYKSGMYEYDTKWTYASNAELQRFLGLGAGVTAIEVRVSDIDAVEGVTTGITDALGADYYARHWKQLNEKLWKALAVEKWVMGILLNMVTVNAGLLIVTTLFMLVLTKGREIAILKAMGATSRSILRIFVMEGSAIGIVGTAAGTALGLLGCAVLKTYEYPLETDVYFLSTLPVVVEPVTVVVIALTSLAICFVATLYPAWRAAALDPVEALRYE
jgi:lipoprotein-releasing system permease protein